MKPVLSQIGYIARGIIYFSLPVMLFAVVVWLAESLTIGAVVTEGSVLETFQCCILVVCASSLFVYSFHFRRHRPFLLFAAALGGLAVLREANNAWWYHKIFSFPGASTLFGVIVIGAIIWRFGGREMFAQMLDVMERRSGLLLAAGTVIVIGWAQVLSQRELFPDRLADRTLEECLESAGYLLILSGVVELYFDLKRRTQFPPKLQTATAKSRRSLEHIGI